MSGRRRLTFWAAGAVVDMTKAMYHGGWHRPAGKAGADGLMDVWIVEAKPGRIHPLIHLSINPAHYPVPANFVAITAIPAMMGARRSVAQLGRAPALGAGCRRFKSCRSDHFYFFIPVPQISPRIIPDVVRISFAGTLAKILSAAQNETEMTGALEQHQIINTQ